MGGSQGTVLWSQFSPSTLKRVQGLEPRLSSTSPAESSCLLGIWSLMMEVGVRGDVH